MFFLKSYNKRNKSKHFCLLYLFFDATTHWFDTGV